MSKVDAQRAMREAKYARMNASAASRREAAAVGGTTEVAAAPAPSVKPAKAAKAVKAVKAAPSAAAAEGELCGHQSMNGRTCTREASHSEKSHRYS